MLGLCPDHAHGRGRFRQRGLPCELRQGSTQGLTGGVPATQSGQRVDARDAPITIIARPLRGPSGPHHQVDHGKAIRRRPGGHRHESSRGMADENPGVAGREPRVPVEPLVGPGRRCGPHHLGQEGEPSLGTINEDPGRNHLSGQPAI